LTRAIAWITCWLNALAIALTPMMAVGRIASIAPRKSGWCA